MAKPPTNCWRKPPRISSRRRWSGDAIASPVSPCSTGCGPFRGCVRMIYRDDEALSDSDHLLSVLAIDDTPARATMRVAGVEFFADLSGALFWERERLLIVSDLHLEKGSSFATRGVLLPPYDTVATLSRLAAVVAQFDPRRVIALGDSFH